MGRYSKNAYLVTSAAAVIKPLYEMKPEDIGDHAKFGDKRPKLANSFVIGTAVTNTHTNGIGGKQTPTSLA